MSLKQHYTQQNVLNCMLWNSDVTLTDVISLQINLSSIVICYHHTVCFNCTIRPTVCPKSGQFDSSLVKVGDLILTFFCFSIELDISYGAKMEFSYILIFASE